MSPAVRHLLPTALVLALLLAVGVPLALRLIDYLLPKGRHLTLVHRFTVEDEETTDETT